MVNGSIDITSFSQITTTRLILEPVNKKYASDIFEARKNPEVNKYLATKSASTIEGLLNWIESVMKSDESDTIQLQVSGSENGEFIGMCGIKKYTTSYPEIGLRFDKSAWGKGYGKELVGALLTWIKANIPYEYIVYETFEENIGSVKIIESFGGLKYSTHKKENYYGEVLSHVQYRIYSPEQPLISVCIPTYNRPKEIQEAISSITMQLDDKLKDIVEIVVSHDPGAANEQEVQQTIEVMAKQRPQIRYYKNEKNMRFSNGSIANAHATGKYIVMLSDDDCLTEFSLSYLVEIMRSTGFDFLLSKPLFTPNIGVPVEQTPNTYTIYHTIHSFIEGLYAKEKTYQYLVSYFSFNSIMVVKASYRNDTYSRIDKEIVSKNEFPQEFPPYYDLKEKIIVFADSTLVKGRVVNASYSGSLKLIRDFKTMINYIEEQNNLSGLKSWKAIKKICVGGWTRTMYLGMLASKLNIDYKKKGFTRRLYFFYKKYLQG